MQRQLSRSFSVSNMDELLDHKEPKDKAALKSAVKSEKTKLNIAVKKSKSVDIAAPFIPREGPLRTSSPTLFETIGERRPLDLPFHAGSDKVLFHIGGYKYLVISQANGVIQRNKLRICELTTDPSRKTILVRLDLQQWVDLCSWGAVIGDVIEKEREREGSGIIAENGRRRFHLGGNVHVTLKKGMAGVDFRWYWLPPSPDIDYKQDPSSFDVQPTRYGIWLTYKEWYKLESLCDLVAKCIPALEGMEECAGQHFNQEGLLVCIHCNPNGHHVWI